MKKKTFTLMTIAAGMLAMAACSDDAAKPYEGDATSKEGISFSLGTDNQTRVEYSEKDWRQMEWNMGDKIVIACSQTQAPTTITDKTAPGYFDDSNWATKTGAAYSVYELIADSYKVTDTYGTETTLTANRKAKVAVSGTAKDALYWGKNDNGNPISHTFYAGYGPNISVTTAGMAKCQYWPEQTLTYDSRRGEWINNGQIYLAAKKTTVPVSDVDLTFKAIMTTLEIQIKGTSADNGADTKIKAVEVTLPESQSKLYMDMDNNAYFDYDIANEEGVDATDKRAEKLIFNLERNALLESGKTMKIVVLLPPVVIDDDNKVTITVDAVDRTNSFKFATAVATGHKVAIESADWRTEPAAAVEDVDWVDLGMGVKWATRNLGASTAADPGDYFGWGCNMPYATSSYVDWPVYFQKLGGSGTAYADCGTAADPLRDYVQPNLINIYNSEWDPATVRLGGKWRMPTLAEIKTLLSTTNCTWTKAADGSGYTVKSKKAGYTTKSIFIPIAGEQFRWGFTNTGNAYYWTSTPYTDGSYAAYGAEITSSSKSATNAHRIYGMLIRPVYDTNAPEAVDLGLSVLWGTCNVGASNPWAYGDYYGWGCTSPYSSSENASWPTYFSKLGKSSTSSWGESKCGTNDDPLKSYVVSPFQEISGTKWDVAHVKLGGKWRMPTQAEIRDLVNKCDWEWTNDYNGTGIAGQKVMLKTNHNIFIFLPAAGCKVGTTFYTIGTDGHYWSATPYTSTNTDYLYKFAQILYATQSDISFGYSNNRFYGFTIRPVRDREPIEAGGAPADYGDSDRLFE